MAKKSLYQKEVEKQAMIKKAFEEANAVRKQFVKKTLDLATSGFGLVAALAWNEVIKETVNTYIKPFFGKESGIISLILYAVLITLLAVVVTYNLSKLAEKK
jgi:hypothetical protein